MPISKIHFTSFNIIDISAAELPPIRYVVRFKVEKSGKTDDHASSACLVYDGNAEIC